MKKCFLIAYITLNTICAADNIDSSVFTSFYPPPFLSQTLSQYNIEIDKQTRILNSLAAKELDVVAIVEDQAKNEDINPLLSGDQKKIIKLFDQAVLQVFSQVMIENGIEDKEQIQAMLQDINNQKVNRFRECLEEMPITTNTQMEAHQHKLLPKP